MQVIMPYHISLQMRSFTGRYKILLEKEIQRLSKLKRPSMLDFYKREIIEIESFMEVINGRIISSKTYPANFCLEALIESNNKLIRELQGEFDKRMEKMTKEWKKQTRKKRIKR